MPLSGLLSAGIEAAVGRVGAAGGRSDLSRSAGSGFEPGKPTLLPGDAPDSLVDPAAGKTLSDFGSAADGLSGAGVDGFGLEIIPRSDGGGSGR